MADVVPVGGLGRSAHRARQRVCDEFSDVGGLDERAAESPVQGGALSRAVIGGGRVLSRERNGERRGQGGQFIFDSPGKDGSPARRRDRADDHVQIEPPAEPPRIRAAKPDGLVGQHRDGRGVVTAPAGRGDRHRREEGTVLRRGVGEYRLDASVLDERRDLFCGSAAQRQADADHEHPAIHVANDRCAVGSGAELVPVPVDRLGRLLRPAGGGTQERHPGRAGLVGDLLHQVGQVDVGVRDRQPVAQPFLFPADTR